LKLSVIIPAYNEERWLPATLEHLRLSMSRLGAPVEVVVVDNQSTDGTRAVASRLGAAVISERVHNVARVRNTGAAAATGGVLVFLDADTLVPENFLPRIAEAMADPACMGGAVDVVHRPQRAVVGAYLAAWRAIGKVCRMAQGAAQFCRREAFDRLQGYDESLYMGEDVDFFWRLRRHARVVFLRDVRVAPSSRRFDQWPLWRILLYTNPLVIALFRRRPVWSGWYTDPVR
jgi:glycosyltransferase involved in cell wall biosynthesis